MLLRTRYTRLAPGKLAAGHIYTLARARNLLHVRRLRRLTLFNTRYPLLEIAACRDSGRGMGEDVTQALDLPTLAEVLVSALTGRATERTSILD
jgi:hypothetical protein